MIGPAGKKKNSIMANQSTATRTQISVSPFVCFSVAQSYKKESIGAQESTSDKKWQNFPSSRCLSEFGVSTLLNSFRAAPIDNLSSSIVGTVQPVTPDQVPEEIKRLVPTEIQSMFVNREIQFYFIVDGQHRNTALRRLFNETKRYNLQVNVSLLSEALTGSQFFMEAERLNNLTDMRVKVSFFDTLWSLKTRLEPDPNWKKKTPQQNNVARYKNYLGALKSYDHDVVWETFKQINDGDSRGCLSSKNLLTSVRGNIECLLFFF